MDHSVLSLMPNFLCGLIIRLTWGNGKIHMDGMAAGQALVAGGLWVVIALALGASALAILGTLIVAASWGFLLHNTPPPASLWATPIE